MNIVIDGNIDRTLKNTLSEAAKFFADRLLDKRVVQSLHLEIDVSSDMTECGLCYPNDFCKYPKDFVIELKIDSVEDMLQSLAHEMVHLKQYAKNQLHYKTVDGKVQTFWLGKPYKLKKNHNPQFDSPYEIEAYGMEVGLMFHWKTRKCK